tara:strand:+ start:341 stop:691 length:351 start_codon:yes stop_codon:yes gene_type:complete
MKKALVFQGKIVQVEDTAFEVHEDFCWFDAPDDVTDEWTFSEGNFTPPDTSIKSQDWDKLRSYRDVLLGRSDWSQGVDSPLSSSKKKEWQTYRQALRDIPANTTDPRDPTWPTKPS